MKIHRGVGIAIGQLVGVAETAQAIVVSSSRFWNNYRHSSNALAFHHVLRTHGIAEADILLFVAQDYSCDCRNSMAGSQFYDNQRSVDLAGVDFPEIDFASNAVNPAAFLRTIAGEHSPFLPRSMRLKSRSEKLFVFFTGHSGKFFMRFQNVDTVTADELNRSFQVATAKRRFDHTLAIFDTCKAATMPKSIDLPDSFHAISSSGDEESSYGYQADLGISAITSDRLSFFSTRFLLHKLKDAPTLGDLHAVLTRDRLGSTATMKNPEIDANVSLADFMTGNEHTAVAVSWTRLTWESSDLVSEASWVDARIGAFDAHMRPNVGPIPRSTDWSTVTLVACAVSILASNFFF